MATIATITNSQNENDDIYLENGRLSYENPNYHMDPKRIERNSYLYEEILSELHQQNAVKSSKFHIKNNRRDYAQIGIESMGIDLKENFCSSEKSLIFDKSPLMTNDKLDQTPEKDESIKCKEDDDCSSNKYNEISNKYSEKNNKIKSKELLNNDCEKEVEEKGKREENEEGIEDKDINKDLPPGWEKHEDNDGPYYWHIKSGTIQREPPDWIKSIKEPKTPTILSQTFASKNVNNSYHYGSRDFMGNRLQESQSLTVTRSNTSSALDREEERSRRDEVLYKRRSYPLKSDSEKPIRFAVRSLGWVEIAEEDLTPERSSKAVNKCIVDLSLGRNDLLDVVGRWGDGKDLFMDLDEGALKLIDPENFTVLNTQPIHTIRVWGVGRDNGRERDFAYVARDRLTRIHMCHVFRCDTAARTIANTLRDICKRIMIERSLQLDNSSNCNLNNNRVINRPTDLPTENRKWIRHQQSFPTPMEEPKKLLKAQYLGSREVSAPTGMDVLNLAIETIIMEVKPEDWENVNVSVAPSMISINKCGENARLITECRVRYLSFLGIGKNVKNCAFIMHTAQDKFIVHVFQCEPSSGALCKTIEAACKLRYQKCLDAHPETKFSSESSTPSKGLGATIKSLMNSLTMKKDKPSS